MMMGTDLKNLSADTKKALPDLVLFAAAMAVLWAAARRPPLISCFLASAVVSVAYCAVFGKIFQFRTAHMIYGVIFAGGVTFFLPLMWFLQGAWETNPNLPNLPVEIFAVLLTFPYLIAVTLTQILRDSSAEKKRLKILTAAAVSGVYVIAAVVVLSLENELYVVFLKETAVCTAIIASGTGVFYALLYRKMPGPKAWGFLPVSVIAVMLASLIGLSYLTNGPIGYTVLPAGDSWPYYLGWLIMAGVYVALVWGIGKAGDFLKRSGAGNGGTSM